jgi:hypothetical protein
LAQNDVRADPPKRQPWVTVDVGLATLSAESPPDAAAPIMPRRCR